MKKPTLIKLAADGQELPADATDWVAVKLPEQGLIFTATQINEEETDQESLQAQAVALDLLGATDWDLPTIDELQLLIDRDRYDPAIDTAFFRDIQSDWYWSKTPAAWSSASAWGVDFVSGDVGGLHRSNSGFALAVRRVGQ
ncbi:MULTISPECIES: DUF1566 domain-containing protein [unclassified Pseudoxanthomonas]|uniref:Lcl C-terminal domain-containing protein n=1 Tax=unclassified Pseudoxanthomonas TaxID=2645906 RepID=UPI00307DB384